MAYTPTTWKDRVVEKPRTYELQDNGNGTITLIPVPGTIYEPGTPVNAPNMNKIETGIKDAHDAAAEAKETAEDHASRTDNPHGVTKAQVGLGSVQNYGIASQAQAQAGSANNVYMTPLRTKNYVDTRLLNNLQFRINNGVVEYNDGTGWKSVGKGGVKSIQKGTFDISSGSSVDVVISPVNPINSLILISSVSIGGGSTRLTLTSEFVDNSTIRFTRSATTASAGTQNWVVIEYDL